MAQHSVSGGVVSIYTARVRMVASTPLPRGWPMVEHSHHFTAATDGAAAGAISHVIDKVKDGPLGARWLCVRDSLVHEVAIYRRALASRRTWDFVAREQFGLDSWLNINRSITIAGVGVNVNIQAAPIWHSTRSAVLVRERTGNPLVQRRVYIGPMEAVAQVMELDLGGIGITSAVSRVWTPGVLSSFPPGFDVGTGDYPYDPGSDHGDTWRPDLAGHAATYCSTIFEDYAPATSVVISWAHGAALAVTEVAPSLVRSDLRSRSSRSGMGNVV